MPQYQTVCRLTDLVEGKGKTVIVDGKDIALFRCGDQVHALEDMCPHMAAPLVGGTVEDGFVTCPWHAWRFRLCDGAWADSPKSKVRVPIYAVRIEGDEVQLQVPLKDLKP